MNDTGRLQGRLDPAPASWACRTLDSQEPPEGLAGPRDTRSRDGREAAFRLPEGQPSRVEFMPLGLTISLRGSDHPPVLMEGRCLCSVLHPTSNAQRGKLGLGLVGGREVQPRCGGHPPPGPSSPSALLRRHAIGEGFGSVCPRESG